MSRIATEPPDLFDHTGGVGHRVGVGHGMNGRETTQRRCLRSGLDGLGILTAGFAQMGMQVDQARQRDQSVGVEHRGPGASRGRSHLLDASVPQQEIGRLARRVCGRR